MVIPLVQEPEDAGLDDASLDEAGDERRGGDRHCTVYRLAKVERESDAGLWRVRNISDHGMMLATTIAVDPGERLQVALSEQVMLTGKVVWARDGRCGVAFDDVIDAVDILRRLAAERQSGEYRPPRLLVRGPAIAVMQEVEYPVEIENLSQNGAGLVHQGELEAGAPLELVLGGDVRRRGIVRWSRGGRAGIWFAPPLEPADLESIRRFAS